MVALGPMNRNSAKARQLVSSLAEAGVTVTSRQLERWSVAGLLPPEPDPEHYRLLAEVAGAGRSFDQAAIALAVRGLPCRRYRDVLLGPLSESSPEQPPADLDSDAGADFVEKTVDDWSEARPQWEGGQEALDPLTGMVNRVIAKESSTLRSKSLGLKALPDSVVDKDYDPTAIGQAFRIDALRTLLGGTPHPVGGLLDAAPFLGPQYWHVVDYWIKNASDHELAAGAAFTQKFLSAVRPFGMPDMTDAQLDLAAGQLAPYLMAALADARSAALWEAARWLIGMAALEGPRWWAYCPTCGAAVSESADEAQADLDRHMATVHAVPAG